MRPSRSRPATPSAGRREPSRWRRRVSSPRARRRPLPRRVAVNPVDLILAAEAVSTGRARRRRLYRHVHLEPAPLAIAAMQMAGEPHALWGMLLGRDPERPRLIVAPEPRNRD